jgi:hypothetical protein
MMTLKQGWPMESCVDCGMPIARGLRCRRCAQEAAARGAGGEAGSLADRERRDREERGVRRLLFWVLVGGGIVGILAGGVYLAGGLVIKSSDACEVAERFVVTHPRVQQSLGTEVSSGWFPSGWQRTDSGKGSAELKLGLSGTLGKGAARVRLSMQNDNWWVTDAALIVAGLAPITLEPPGQGQARGFPRRP